MQVTISRHHSELEQQGSLSEGGIRFNILVELGQFGEWFIALHFVFKIYPFIWSACPSIYPVALPLLPMGLSWPNEPLPAVLSFVLLARETNLGVRFGVYLLTLS